MMNNQNVTEQECSKAVQGKMAEAMDFARDSNKVTGLFQKAGIIGSRIVNLKESFAVFKEIPQLYRLLQDWFSGRYKTIPYKSILMIIAAVIYFVCPIDLINDGIPIVGFLDDVGVMQFVLNAIQADLHAYNQWLQDTAAQRKENANHVIFYL